MPDTPSVEAAWKSWQDKPDDTRRRNAYKKAVQAARSAPTLQPGEIVADAYRLDEILGEGGLCATWRAMDLRGDVPVALKVLHPRFGAKPAMVKRFHTALHQQGQVAERGVMAVRDEGGTWEGFAWAAVQLGATNLAQRLPELDELDRTQVLIDVATALHNAHAAGLAHGRLSPQNVLVDDDGGAWLTDFALVPPSALDSPFAPPEAGDPAYRPTIVADRYAFAMLVTWVLRGGTLPYWAARDPMRAVDELHVGRELRDALEQSIGWDPEARPDDLGDLLRALRGDAASVRALAERSMSQQRPEAALDHYRHLLAVTAGDPDVRVELATALAQSGRERQAIDQLYAALRAPKLRRLEQALDALRGLVDRAGELPMLLHALEQRAAEPFAQNDVILVEIARLKGRLHEDDEDEAWKRALEHHTRRDQAKLCLWALAETAAANEDDAAFVAWGTRLAPLVDDAGTFAYRMGRAYQRLDDPEAALHWYDQALAAESTEADVHVRIEAIRSDRGDWGQVVEVLRARAATEEDPVPLWRKAARIAHRAAGDEDLAAELYAEIVRTLRHDVEARCFLADRARRCDEPVAEREHLRQLDPTERTDEELPASERAARLVRLATLYREDGHPDDARACVDAVLEAQPSHVPALWMRALLLRDAGEDPSEPLTTLTALLPADTDDGAAARLALAEEAWLAGDRGRSHDIAQSVLAVRPELPDATWALVRAAFGPEDEQQPWLRALPPRFPLREGLARLAEVAVDLGALELRMPPEAAPMEQAAALVDRLVASGEAEAFLDRIGDAHRELRDLVDPLARAWQGTADAGWSVRSLVLCNPSTRDRVQRTVRPPLPTPTSSSPWSRDLEPLRAEALPLRDAVELAGDLGDDDAAAVEEAGDARALILLVHPGDLRQQRIPLALDGPMTLGSGPGSDLRVEGLKPGHATLEVVHDAVYLISHEDPIRIAGVEVEEVRLRQGLSADIGGVRIEVRGPDSDLGTLDLEDLQDDDPTAVLPAEGTPSTVALFVTDAGEDYLLPLEEVTPICEGHRLVQEADGWRLEGDDPSVSRLYVVGDHFVIDGVRYALRPVLSVTPAPAPRMEPTAEAVPTLVVNDGTLLGRVVGLKAPRTTIGRGRACDLSLPEDTRISRHHCALEIRHDGTVVVVDTGSANGTYVDGEPVVDEHVLKPGEIIEVGDTTLEFQLGSYVEPEQLDDDGPGNEDLESSPTLMLPATHTKRLSLSDGRHRLAIANRALAPILHGFDDAIGPGAAAGELQFLLEAAPKRYHPVFEGVEGKPTGLPALPILHNIARLPEWEQRSLLNAALLDLLERATQRCADRLDEDACATMLTAVSASNYRKHLKI